jgi:hypothetical protein
MSTQIKAKVFKDDTLNVFLYRIRKIVHGINQDIQIGLYELDNHDGPRVKNENSSGHKELKLSITPEAPLKSYSIIRHIDDIK